MLVSLRLLWLLPVWRRTRRSRGSGSTSAGGRGLLDLGLGSAGLLLHLLLEAALLLLSFSCSSRTIRRCSRFLLIETTFSIFSEMAFRLVSRDSLYRHTQNLPEQDGRYTVQLKHDKKKQTKHKQQSFWGKENREGEEKELSETDLNQTVKLLVCTKHLPTIFADTHGVGAYYLYTNSRKYIYLH